MMLPVIDALTSSTCPLRSATMAMISSAALPNVALRKPPQAGPGAPRELLGAEADEAGERDQRCGRGDEHPRRPVRHRTPATQETGAAISRRLMGDEAMARNMDAGRE